MVNPVTAGTVRALGLAQETGAKERAESSGKPAAVTPSFHRRARRGRDLLYQVGEQGLDRRRDRRASHTDKYTDSVCTNTYIRGLSPDGAVFCWASACASPAARQRQVHCVELCSLGVRQNISVHPQRESHPCPVV